MLKVMQSNLFSTLRGLATYHSRFGYPKLGGAESYYDVLKVPLNSSGKEIKRAYIELSKKYHPDSNCATGDPEEFVKVCEAYKILYKRVSRDRYNSRMNTHLHMTPPLDTSFSCKNVQKSWEKYRAAMRSKQFGRNIPNFNGSKIVHRKPIALPSRGLIRMPNAGASTEPITPILDRIIYAGDALHLDWRLKLYIMGFGIVCLILAFKNRMAVKRDRHRQAVKIL